jgi:hypothetical protein
MKRNLYQHFGRDEKRLSRLNPTLGKLVREDHSAEYRAQIEAIVVASRLAAMPEDANLIGLETANALKQVKKLFNDRSRLAKIEKQRQWRKASITEANLRIQKMAELVKTESPMELGEFPTKLVPTNRQPKIATFLKNVLGLERCRELFAPE